MRVARWIFLLSAIYGMLVSTPMFFLEERIGRDQPPAITHPEFFYGFAGLCVAWQLMFFLIASDPIRYRPAMLVAVLEKLGWVITVPVLFMQGRIVPLALVFAGMDGVMMVLFVVAYVKTGNRWPESGTVA